MENYLSLLGVLIVIVGFALKLDSILIVMVALVVTALTGGLGIGGMLETLGQVLSTIEEWQFLLLSCLLQEH